jgi:hypothetical protein
MLLLVVAVAIAIFWRAAREKPKYGKTYYDTRSSGVYRTEYAPGFEEYLKHVESEVSARFTHEAVRPRDPRDAEVSRGSHGRNSRAAEARC